MINQAVEYDESDLEADFEDLEYDESRRRKGRSRSRPPIRTNGRAWQPQRPPATTTAATLRREADAGRVRDRALAKGLNTAKADVDELQQQLSKAYSDQSSMSLGSLIAQLLPGVLEVTTTRLSVEVDATGAKHTIKAVAAAPGTTAAAGEVDVITGVTPKPNLMSLLFYMMTVGDAGKPLNSRNGVASPKNRMMPLAMIALLPQLQGQKTGGTSTGGFDTTTLLIMMMAMGQF